MHRAEPGHANWSYETEHEEWACRARISCALARWVTPDSSEYEWKFGQTVRDRTRPLDTDTLMEVRGSLNPSGRPPKMPE